MKAPTSKQGTLIPPCSLATVWATLVANFEPSRKALKPKAVEGAGGLVVHIIVISLRRQDERSYRECLSCHAQSQEDFTIPAGLAALSKDGWQRSVTALSKINSHRTASGALGMPIMPTCPQGTPPPPDTPSVAWAGSALGWISLMCVLGWGRRRLCDRGGKRDLCYRRGKPAAAARQAGPPFRLCHAAAWMNLL